MHCEFCASPLSGDRPENLALFDHLRDRKACKEQYGYLLENLRSSWTVNMSGG